MFLLDPEAVLDFAFDWKSKTHNQPGAISDWLENGETITAQTVVAVNNGVTVGSVTQVDGLITYWLSAGTANTVQHVTCHIETNMGRTDERSVAFNVAAR